MSNSEKQGATPPDQQFSFLSGLSGLFYRSAPRSNREMTFCSEGVLDLLGITPAEFTSPEASRETGWMVSEDREGVCRSIQASLDKEIPFELTYRVRHRDGRILWVLDKGRGVSPPDGGAPTCIEGFLTDFTEHKQQELQREGRSIVLEMLARNRPLSEVLDALCRAIEKTRHGILCSILLVDPATGRLTHGAGPGFPDYYLDAVDGTPIAMGSGSCGEAAFSGKRVIAEDLATHPNWSRFTHMAVDRAGLRACWSEPVKGEDSIILGTFAIYYREPKAPEDADIELIGEAAQIAGIAIENARNRERIRRAGEELEQKVVQRTGKLHREIQERERAEKELRKSEGLLRQIIDLVPHMIFAKDWEGRFLLANKATADAYGTTPDALAGVLNGDIHPSREEMRRILADDRSVMAGKREKLVENYTLPGEDGEVRHLQATKIPLVRPESESPAVVGIAVDVTEHKHQEALIRASERRFKDIAESASDWIWEMDADLRFSYLSDRFYEVSGYERGDVVGRTREEIAGERNVAEAPETWRRLRDDVAHGRSFRNFNYMSKTKSGSPLHVRISGRPYYDGEGTFQGYRGTGTDITVLRHAQERLIRSEKMAALGELVAGVAHELNTPLGIAVTSASYLEEETRALKTAFETGQLGKKRLTAFLDDAEDSTRLLLDNLERASKLISSFKLVAVDRSHDNRRHLNLRQYIDEVLLSLKPRLKKTGHRVLNRCSAELYLHMNPGAFSQVLINLVMNSLIHGFEEIDSGEIRIEAEESGGEVLITYSDNGMGMSERQVARVFDPFYTSKRGSGGSGLGMNIVFNLVSETLSGSIACSSEPGKGARFFITLPLS